MNTTPFSQQMMDLLKANMETRQVPKGTSLFQEQEPSKHLYYVWEGQIQVMNTTGDEKLFVIQLYHPGDLLGASTEQPDIPCCFQAEATADSVVGVIGVEKLRELMKEHPELAVQLVKWLTLMERSLQLKLRDLFLYGKQGALAATLLRLCHTYGVRRDSEIRIEQRFTHADLAKFIGATRESVNRMVNKWRKKQILSVEDGYLIVQDSHALKNMCHCMNCAKEVCRL
ncbi:Crp/Fnr family transcriptional regulator [Brevibacillus ruminantium]|uniref:Crp/Fnr family transcriptional regulator n=1 Tax=Brevibacillus ruminantium TaxID=2950604 RepID=A0ABY4WJ60_9BACL|nr:Crp/Fnr family transcriptional regulator [Brevibacillus ruminantium]USG66203.1 Crp/Fnr family transcriptional regulator [Brevibacillus ruminantium]